MRLPTLCMGTSLQNVRQGTVRWLSSEMRSCFTMFRYRSRQLALSMHPATPLHIK